MRQKSRVFIILFALVLAFSFLIISNEIKNGDLSEIKENIDIPPIAIIDKDDVKNARYWPNCPTIHIKNDNWTYYDLPWIYQGSGTIEDPHIIENVIIDAAGAEYCILIENSNDYFIIRNCTVFNANEYGIKLYYTNNGKIMDNTIYDNLGASWSCGISLEYCDYNNIIGNDVSNHNAGISMYYSNYNNIIGNNIKYNSRRVGRRDYGRGITFNHGEGNIISENNILHSYYCLWMGGTNSDPAQNNIISKNYFDHYNIDIFDPGIELYGMYIEQYCRNNVITENIIANNSGADIDSRGIYCVGAAQNNEIYYNVFIGNTYPAQDSGSNQWNTAYIGNYWDNWQTGDSDGDGINDNSYSWLGVTDNKPIYENPIFDGSKIDLDDTGVSGPTWKWASTRFWCEGEDTVSGPYVIKDLEIDGGGWGFCITIQNSEKYFTIENCHVSNADYGIKLVNVNNSKIINNDCSFNNENGIYLKYCQNNTVFGNFVKNNSYNGIVLENSHRNFILENILINNYNYGIYLDPSNYNYILDNIVNNSKYGIYLDESNYNTILRNEFNGITIEEIIEFNCVGNKFSESIGPVAVTGDDDDDWTTAELFLVPIIIVIIVGAIVAFSVAFYIVKKRST